MRIEIMKGESVGNNKSKANRKDDTVLYLDCSMGAAGDMLAASLYELLDEEDKAWFIKTMNELAPGQVEVSVRSETKCGIVGTHYDVVVNGTEELSTDYYGGGHEYHHSTYEHEHNHDHVHNHDHNHNHDHDHDHDHFHHHHSMADIEGIIKGFSSVSDGVKKNIIEVYKIIAAAESKVHGTTVTEIHFHEVGMMDAIIDVTAVCILMDKIGACKVYASPVRTGSGHVRCAHGVLPVPTPATANILMGIPTYAGDIEAELCTPTGAALLRHFATEYGEQPIMTVNKIGYGMGTKDFEIANMVRAMLGTEL